MPAALLVLAATAAAGPPRPDRMLKKVATASGCDASVVSATLIDHQRGVGWHERRDRATGVSTASLWQIHGCPDERYVAWVETRAGWSYQRVERDYLDCHRDKELIAKRRWPVEACNHRLIWRSVGTRHTSWFPISDHHTAWPLWVDPVDDAPTVEVHEVFPVRLEDGDTVTLTVKALDPEGYNLDGTLTTDDGTPLAPFVDHTDELYTTAVTFEEVGRAVPFSFGPDGGSVTLQAHFTDPGGHTTRGDVEVGLVCRSEWPCATDGACGPCTSGPATLGPGEAD